MSAGAPTDKCPTEGEHQPAAHPTGLEQAVRVGRLLGGERPRHPQRHDAVLGLLPQPVERGAVLRHPAHERREHPQVARAVAAVAAHRGHRAAVLHRRQHERVLHRAVGQAVDALGEVLADPVGDVVAAPDDDVGAEASAPAPRRPRTRRRRRSARRPWPAGRRSRRTRPPRRSPPATCPGCSAMRSSASRAVRPFIGSVDAATASVPFGGADDRVAGQHEVLPVAAVRAGRDDDPHDRRPPTATCVDALADLDDHAGDVHARHPRRLRDRVAFGVGAGRGRRCRSG